MLVSSLVVQPEHRTKPPDTYRFRKLARKIAALFVSCMRARFERNFWFESLATFAGQTYSKSVGRDRLTNKKVPQAQAQMHFRERARIEAVLQTEFGDVRAMHYKLMASFTSFESPRITLLASRSRLDAFKLAASNPLYVSSSEGLPNTLQHFHLTHRSVVRQQRMHLLDTLR
jgi:hypothetical protein